MNTKQLKASLKRKGWHFFIQDVCKKLCPIRWVRDIDVMNQLYEHKAYRFLKRKYLPRLKEFVPVENILQQQSPKIWVCWFQGEENAPEIVKRCIRSIREHAGGKEVVVVTNENLHSLVEIPLYISEKMKKKKMLMAHYSDYIRLALLTKYGGVWVDATVFLTDVIPEKLLSLPLFCFKNSYLSKSCTVASSWLIIAQPGNLVLQQVKYLLDYYWSRESCQYHYFLFHLLFALVVNYDSGNRLQWKNVPYINNVDVHTMQFELFEPYDSKRFAEITSRAFAHKLTYKFKDETLCAKPGTLYKFLLGSKKIEE